LVQYRASSGAGREITHPRPLFVVKISRREIKEREYAPPLFPKRRMGGVLPLACSRLAGKPGFLPPD
jgi:hypothetical protein